MTEPLNSRVFNIFLFNITLRLQGCAIIYNMFANACLHKKPVPEIHSCIFNMVIDFINIMIIHFRNIHTIVPQLPQTMLLNIIHFVENNSYLNLVLSQDENPWNYKMYYLILILCVHIIFFSGRGDLFLRIWETPQKCTILIIYKLHNNYKAI